MNANQVAQQSTAVDGEYSRGNIKPGWLKIYRSQSQQIYITEPMAAGGVLSWRWNFDKSHALVRVDLPDYVCATLIVKKSGTQKLTLPIGEMLISMHTNGYQLVFELQMDSDIKIDRIYNEAVVNANR